MPSRTRQGARHRVGRTKGTLLLSRVASATMARLKHLVVLLAIYIGLTIVHQIISLVREEIAGSRSTSLNSTMRKISLLTYARRGHNQVCFTTETVARRCTACTHHDTRASVLFITVNTHPSIHSSTPSMSPTQRMHVALTSNRADHE